MPLKQRQRHYTTYAKVVRWLTSTRKKLSKKVSSK